MEPGLAASVVNKYGTAGENTVKSYYNRPKKKESEMACKKKRGK